MRTGEPKSGQGAENAVNYVLIIYVRFLRASYADLPASGEENCKALLEAYFALAKQCTLDRG